MINDCCLTASEAKELFHYSAETGELIWKKSLNPRGPVGAVAGTMNDQGYIIIGVHGRLFRAHRIVYLMLTGSWPTHQVDHENGVRHDNREDNIRDTTCGGNNKNRALACDSISGHAGVNWDASRSKWMARIKVDGVQVYLGRFSNKKHAVRARVAAERKHGFHPNHGLRQSVRGER